MPKTTIEKREFVRHFSQYLKQPGTYCLTGREGLIEVEIRNVGQSGPVELETMNLENGNTVIYPKKDGPDKAFMQKFHRCGCEKNGSALCKKHGRY